MEDLIKKQATDGKLIQKYYNNFKKDSSSRKTKQYVEVRLQALNSTWSSFEERHAELENYQSEAAASKYFTDNFYTKVEMIYDQAREAMEEALREAIERSKTSERIEEQLRKIRKQMTLIDTLTRALENTKSIMKTKISNAYFKQTTNLLSGYWERIVSNHEEIMALGKFKDDYFDSDVFSKTEEQYQSVLIQLQELNDSCAMQTAESTVVQGTKATTNSTDPNRQETHVRLPRIDIPAFNGDYLKWQSFKDLFTELIHKDDRITKSEKLFYLKTNLRGEPNELIQHLSITGDNYDTAWNILTKRYNNQRTLVSAHLRTLLQQPEITKESAESLKKLHDTTTECLEAIKNLRVDTTNWDPLIIFLLQQKLDKETRRLYEQSLKDPRGLQKVSEFLDFLENRFQGLEGIEPTKNYVANKGAEKTMKVHHSTIGQQPCSICKDHHKIYACEKFAKLTAQQRWEAIRKAMLCSNCLMKGHSIAKCKSWKSCKICNKKHHTLLHSNPTIKQISNSQSSTKVEQRNEGMQDKPATTSTSVATHVAESRNQRTVLLATALIQAIDKTGRPITLRALIDQGSQGSFITENAAQTLRLPRKRVHAVITGVGETNVETIQAAIQLELKPRFMSTFSLITTVLVLKKLTKLLPSERILTNTWSHTRNLILADPKYYEPGKIDIILGADVFGKILLENVIRGAPGSPIAQETEFGWILSGEVQNDNSNTEIQCLVSDVDITKELRKFWEIEELQCQSTMTSEDIACEKHYTHNVRRGADGRYTVRIPYREDPADAENLDGSKTLALARLLQMERKFKVDKTFAYMYKDFMNEYLRLGHMLPVTDNTERGYYLPHHAVLKKDSTTTKLRVVFDASAKRNNSRSINELMMVGPQIQQNLTTILLRWRKHKIVYTADIEKMYRQIKVDIRDQDYQRILWRESPEEPIREFKLTTVTYGTASAPFLAIRTLHQLAKDEQHNYPKAAEVLLSDTYVDDILSGGSTLKEAKESSDQLIKLLKTGGFNLRKWTSNSRELLRQIPSSLREIGDELDFETEKSIKALGVHWNPSTDNFKVQVNIINEEGPMTKRKMLSESAKIFDPIGLLAPVTVKIKLLLQQLWEEEVHWDEKVPSNILQEWNRIKRELPTLQRIKIPRWINYTGETCRCELHGFSDASERAYSAAVYLRVIQGTNIYTNLLSAKTKLAPLKTKLTIPRLELCGATLLANLLKETRESLQIEDLEWYAWTDSTAVLSWIQENPHTWKAFVGNRVAEIQSLIDDRKWFHVRSCDNPADIASRGVYPSVLENSILWWKGPQWLKEKIIMLPPRPASGILEERKIQCNAISTSDQEAIITTLLRKYSSLGKLLRIIAYCYRFTKNIKTKDGKITGSLSVREIENALIPVIKVTQDAHFAEEISRLKEGKEVQKGSRLIALYPFLDKNEILRVGGRLGNSDMSYERKHPIILPYKHELTSLVLDNAHRVSCHGGNSLTLEVTRQKYWIMNGLKAVKGHIHKCLKCHRYKAQTSQQVMGMLPKARVTTSPPFTHTGVDYAGPFDILLTKGRGNKSQKGYISMFICLATKAIHIEVVTELTAKAFIAAFRRFVARRGPVAHLYSDNGTNFVGASKIISDLHKQDSYQIEVSEALRESHTQWHFIPPASPHFGGLWEAGVKSIKFHMRRIIGETRLTYEEMCTLMAQIEACLNSRPLCPLSEDPESLEILTPGHFLTGSPLLTIPEKNHLETNPNLLDRWGRVQRMHQEFWKKWSMEYVGRLQFRPKWAQRQSNLKKGNLVIIKEDNLPPSRWALGRVIETHPGSDGLTRVVTLQTQRGKIKRPIVKLSLLPLIDNKPNDLTEAFPTEESCSIPKKRPLDESANSNKDKRVKHETPPKRTTTTRSCNTSLLSYIMLGTLLVLTALGQEINQPFELTKFGDHEGIYFDDIAEVQLYGSEWNLLIYYDLSTYWSEFFGIKKSIRRLSELCEEERSGIPKELCSATILQLNHQLLESEHINEVLYQQNEKKISTRSKRAPLEIIGTAANKLFGILDQDFADRYEAQIERINSNEMLLRKLLENQTSIAEHTVNVLRKNHQTIQHQLNQIETHIEAIENSVNHSRQELMVTQTFNSAAILVTLNLVNFQHVQRSILSVVMDTKHGRLNTLLLTPSQLREQLKIIREHLPEHLKLPGADSTSSILALYNTMYVKMRITERKVLFDTQIPLLRSESYHLYKLIPIPALNSHNYIYIEPSSEFLVVNRHRDRSSPLTQQDVRECLHSADLVLICKLKQPLFTLKSNQSRCEMDLLSKQTTISPFCQLRSKVAQNSWIKLHLPSTWMYVMKEETHFDVICETSVHPISLKGSGIIKLHSSCMINHPTLTIYGNKRIKGQMRSSFIPDGQVISRHLNISIGLQSPNSSILRVPQLRTEINSDDFAELDTEIKNLRQSYKDIPELSNHDLHHYSMTYILLIALVALFIYYKYRRGKTITLQKKNKGENRPQPAPRRTIYTAQQQSTVDLPSLSIDGGECAMHI